MTPSKYIKAQGLPSLSYVANKVNLTRPTLYNWYKNNYVLFEVVVAGVKVKFIDECKESLVGWSREETREKLKKALNI